MRLILCLRTPGLWARAAGCGPEEPAAVLHGRRVVDCTVPGFRAGVRPGMGAREAVRRCPGLRLERLEDEDCRLHALWDAACREAYALSPWLHVLGPGALLLSLAFSPRCGMDGLRKDLSRLAGRLCPRLGDRVLVGAAGSACAARLLAGRLLMGEEPGAPAALESLAGGHATLALLPPGREPELLDPVPVEELESLPRPLRRELARLGLRTLGDVRRAGAAALREALGEDGLMAWRLAAGEDRALPAPNYPPPEATAASPPGDLCTPQQVHEAVRIAAESLARALAERGAAARSLWLRLEGARVAAGARRFARPRAGEAALCEAARALAEELLARGGEGLFPVTRLELYARDLTPLPARQEGLLPRPEGLEARQERALRALSHLRRRYPAAAARLGAELERPFRERMLAYWDPLRMPRSRAAGGAP